MGLIKSLLRKIEYYNTAKLTASNLQADDFLATVPAKEIYGSNVIATKASLDKVVFLRRANQSAFSFEPISRRRLKNRMFSIIMREWKDNISELHELGSLELIDLHSYFDEMSKITAEAIEDVPCYELVIPSDASPKQITEKYLQQCESEATKETIDNERY
jgi:hypothetical protein